MKETVFKSILYDWLLSVYLTINMKVAGHCDHKFHHYGDTNLMAWSWFHMSLNIDALGKFVMPLDHLRQNLFQNVQFDFDLIFKVVPTHSRTPFTWKLSHLKMLQIIIIGAQ